MFWAAGVVASPAAQWLERRQPTRPAASRSEPDLTVPGLPERLRHRRHRPERRLERQAGAGSGAGGQAAGRLRRARDPGPPRRPRRTAAVPLPPSGQSRHHRPARRRSWISAGVRFSGALAWWLWGVAACVLPGGRAQPRVGRCSTGSGPISPTSAAPG
ncbi:MAG: hypothetical protein MZV63_19315 [Marinilabiliales bacterium]|nr:hypothetical protein [Marinilabiliales bacterium]